MKWSKRIKKTSGPQIKSKLAGIWILIKHGSQIALGDMLIGTIALGVSLFFLLNHDLIKWLGLLVIFAAFTIRSTLTQFAKNRRIENELYVKIVENNTAMVKNSTLALDAVRQVLKDSQI